jgi:hypothetical protein
VYFGYIYPHKWDIRWLWLSLSLSLWLSLCLSLWLSLSLSVQYAI